MKLAPARDYAAIAQDWQDRVMRGEIALGAYHKKAVERQLRDLERAEAGWCYTYDAERGKRVCHFVEQWQHIKGDKAGERLQLDPWQIWALMVLFSWVAVGDPKRRRFRRAQWWLCRGQGKSFLAALLGLYFLATDKGAEVLTAATNEEQARCVFDTAKWALRRAPDLASGLGLRAEEHRLLCEAGVMRPVTSIASSSEGANVSLAIVDELHAHPTRDLLDTLVTGCGKRKGAMLLVISTAPTDLAGVGYEVWDAGRKILSRSIDEDQEMVLIVAADEGQDPYAESTIRQANPGIGSSVDLDAIMMIAREARAKPSLLAAYESRHLGWVRRHSEDYVSLSSWASCEDPAMARPGKWRSSLGGHPIPALLETMPCWIGVDLAHRIDVACVAILGRQIVDERAHYYAHVIHYLPQATIESSRTSQYRGWADTGLFTVVPGKVTDYDVIERDLKSLHKALDVRESAFDPWQAAQMIGHLQDAGYTAIDLKPTYGNLSSATKELAALVLDRRIHHGADPILAWMLSNVVIKRDGKENHAIAKERPENKIDGIMALVTALARALEAPADEDMTIVML
jgi:phage terminase large subunit-like protein